MNITSKRFRRERRYGSAPNKLSNRQKRFLKGRLRELGMKSYFEYLCSDQWHLTRERFRASGLHQTCLVCFDPNVDLHHRTYSRLGKERLDDLVALCRRHHEQIHVEGLDLWKGPSILREQELSRRKKGRTTSPSQIVSTGVA